MTNREKIDRLNRLMQTRSANPQRYADCLTEMGDFKIDYTACMTTAPIDAAAELSRVPKADYTVCAAILTMLLREDHFCNGILERRVRAGEVERIIQRMIKLLQEQSKDMPK